MAARAPSLRKQQPHIHGRPTLFSFHAFVSRTLSGSEISRTHFQLERGAIPASEIRVGGAGR